MCAYLHIIGFVHFLVLLIALKYLIPCGEVDFWQCAPGPLTHSLLFAFFLGIFVLAFVCVHTMIMRALRLLSEATMLTMSSISSKGHRFS